MRLVLVPVVVLLGVVTVLTTVVLAPCTAVADQLPPELRCFDCEGLGCHAVAGPGYHSCTMGPDGCTVGGECD